MKWFVLVELFTGSKIRKILYHSLDCIIFLNAKIDTISGFFLKKIKKISTLGPSIFYNV